MIGIVGIDQRHVQLTLDDERHLARAVLVFHQQRHDLGPDAQIVDAAQIVTAQAALAIEDQHRRRALHVISDHGLGDLIAARFVVSDGNGNAGGLEEYFDVGGRLLFEIFKRHVQAEDRDFALGESFAQPRGLRQSELDRTRAHDLKRRHDDDFALVGFERLLAVGIQPALGNDLRGAFWIEHWLGPWGSSAEKG